MRPGWSGEKLLEGSTTCLKTSEEEGKVGRWIGTADSRVSRLIKDKGTLHLVKKNLTPTQIFSKIVREKHEVFTAGSSKDFSKFPHKHFSHTLLNGLVNRTYSRSRLEEFTRPNPLGLTLDLRSRINTIIDKKETQKMGKQKRPALARLATMTGKPAFLTKPTQTRASLDPSASQSSRQWELVHESIKKVHNKGKQLTLEDFTEERTLLRGLGSQGDSSLERSRDRSQGKYSTKGIMRLSGEDFFPERYKLAARKDREIIDKFIPHPLYVKRPTLARRPSHKLL